VDELVRMARNLEAAGATMRAIACNTAHAYSGDIAASVGIPLLDMVALTAEQIAGEPLKHRRVGMLASTAVLGPGLYERAFEAFGIETRYPHAQEEVLRLVKAVKKEGVTAELRGEFNAVARDLIADDVDLLIVACTELSLLVDGLDTDIAAIDVLDVLVAAIIKRASQPPAD
jgi:aspartate racemase